MIVSSLVSFQVSAREMTSTKKLQTSSGGYIKTAQVTSFIPSSFSPELPSRSFRSLSDKSSIMELSYSSCRIEYLFRQRDRDNVGYLESVSFVPKQQDGCSSFTSVKAINFEPFHKHFDVTYWSGETLRIQTDQVNKKVNIYLTTPNNNGQSPQFPTSPPSDGSFGNGSFGNGEPVASLPFVPPTTPPTPELPIYVPDSSALFECVRCLIAQGIIDGSLAVAKATFETLSLPANIISGVSNAGGTLENLANRKFGDELSSQIQGTIIEQLLGELGRTLYNLFIPRLDCESICTENKTFYSFTCNGSKNCSVPEKETAQLAFTWYDRLCRADSVTLANSTNQTIIPPGSKRCFGQLSYTLTNIGSPLTWLWKTCGTFKYNPYATGGGIGLHWLNVEAKGTGGVVPCYINISPSKSRF
jgi:hypothetical protein